MNYKIYIPSGNPTALVIGIEEDPIKRKQINDEILSKYSFVEQVGFINEDKIYPCLLMAGGEFCGNASRCAIYYYLDGREGTIELTVLGVNLKIKGGIKDNKVWAFMPIIDNPLTMIDEGAIIKLPGITHIVVENNSLNPKELLKKYNLMNELASGVMFIKRDKDNILLTPYVYVKSINTEYLETACGSGTTAVGIYESYRLNKSVDIDVIQPSNKIINVKTTFNNKIEKVIISGNIKEEL